MSNKHLSHSVAHAVSHHLPHICNDLPPLKEGKSPFTAGIMGFLFGPFGIGLYFKSWLDFGICFAILVILAMTGVLAPVGWMLAAVYGIIRAKASNKKRAEHRHSDVVVTSAPVVRLQPPPLPVAAPPQLPPPPQIYLSIQERSHGPFSEASVRQKLDSGEISNSTLFWIEGMPAWKPLGARA